MKLIQMIPAPSNLMIVYNGYECEDEEQQECYMVACIEKVVAFGLYDNGNTKCLVIDEYGKLQGIDEKSFVRTYYIDDNGKEIN